MAAVPSGHIFVWRLSLKEDGEVESEELYGASPASSPVDGFAVRLAAIGQTLFVAAAPKELCALALTDGGAVELKGKTLVCFRGTFVTILGTVCFL